MIHNGIHHVTAIAGAARRNLDFYTGTLGLRLVKRTVNFDDPGTYHFYYGDETGTPGTILTFFPWDHAALGRLGIGEIQETVFRVPEEAIGYWIHRFVDNRVAHEAPQQRFGESVLAFRDPDGMRLALVATPRAENEPIFVNRYDRPLRASGVRFRLREYVVAAANERPRLREKHVTRHTFRHTAAVHLVAAGVDVTVIQSWLGHVHLDTTFLYAQANVETKRRALEQADGTARSARPPRWKREPALLAWLDSL